MISIRLSGPAWIISRRKRLLDLALLILLLPFVILIATFAFMISATENGIRRALFTQYRIGRHGQLFTIHKFRTMPLRTNRLSPSGELLSILGADETPQLLYTIWTGRMSLIGPRPLVATDFPVMRAALGHRKFRQWYRAYTACRPGWMSMFSPRSRTYGAQSPDYLRARHYYDTYYYRHACFMLDLVTLCRSLGMWCTPPARIIVAIARLVGLRR